MYAPPPARVTRSPESLIRSGSRFSPFGLIDRIPWLAGFSASRPTLAKIALYWLVSSAATFLIVFVQGAPTLIAALVLGAFPQVFEALGLLVVTSLAIGPVYAPIWFGLLLIGKFGSAGGWLILIIVGLIAWKVFMFWINLPTLGLRSEGRQHARLQGRLSDAEVVNRFRAPGKSTKVGGVNAVTGMIPLGYIKGQPIGLAWTGDSGHVAVVGPPVLGKACT